MPLRTIVPLLLAALLAAGCATTASTSFEASWVDPQLQKKTYRKVLIMTIASDEFAQQYFQEEMAAQLGKRGVNAVASRKYFTRYTEAEKRRFRQAIEQSDADVVLLGRVIGVDEKSGRSGGYLIGPNGMPYADATGLEGAWAQAFNPTHYVPQNEFTSTSVQVEVSAFARKSEKLVWTARTNTRNADKGDLKPAVAQLVQVVVDAMLKDDLL